MLPSLHCDPPKGPAKDLMASLLPTCQMRLWVWLSEILALMVCFKADVEALKVVYAELKLGTGSPELLFSFPHFVQCSYKQPANPIIFLSLTKILYGSKYRVNRVSLSIGI